MTRTAPAIIFHNGKITTLDRKNPLAGAAEATPPIRRMIDEGVKVSAGTDLTRVASYNPWVSLSWITGKTVGGMNL